MLNYLDILTALSGLFIIFSIYYHIKVFSFWSSRGIPGPTPWPIFGTNIYYLLYNKIEIDLYWREKYGRTYGLYEGVWPQLRTTDADVIKQIYVKEFQSCTDRNHRFTYNQSQLRWMLWSRGDYWSNQRALVSPMFSANKMRQMVSTISSCVDRFLNFVDTKNGEGKKSFDKFDLSSLTLDVIAASFFGMKLDTYASKKDEFVLNAYRFADFNFTRFLVWLFIPARIAAYFKFELISEDKFRYFEVLSQRIINDRRKEQSSKRSDVIQALINAKLPDKYEQVFTKLDDKEAHYNADIKHGEMEQVQQQQTNEARYFRHFSDDEIQGQMTFFFIAGFETTASTISFALYELANQPLVQEKILVELRDTFGFKGEKFEQSEASEIYNQILGLKYLDAFLSELLRLFPPIINVHRMVTSKTGLNLVIDGHKVNLPEGVSITTNGIVVHRDKEYYERPDEFDITRFYPENKQKIRMGAFVPFGIGPRHCVGMRFALLEIKLALAKLLLRFEIKTAEKNQHPPKFKHNNIFLQYEISDFKLVARK